MAKIAVIFPGQGSQSVGMGRDFYDRYPRARGVFEEADRALKRPLSKLCFEGPQEELQLTENTQPGLLTVSIAIWSLLNEVLHPEFVAGHSLGEYTALTAAGALRFTDAVRLVRKRGEFMQQAVPVGQGAMLAILGAEPERVEELCREAAQGQVLSPANFNCPGQIVIAGNSEAIKRAAEMAPAMGIKRTIPLAVSAPFHCALMKPAQENMMPLLMEQQFFPLKFPIVTNVDASITQLPEQARDALIRQIPNPVRWWQSIELLIRDGVSTFIEVGAGKVLTGMIRKISRDVQTFNVENVEDYEQLRAKYQS
ncbi:MAG TPA: ACP S-malonyltransferase [Acidobacteriota bacterium]|nr:ACP S-malonyltransferase [Acidobacteriota bacterium]